MEKDSKIYLIGGLIIGVIIVALVIIGAKGANSGPGQLDEFATCLKDSGATFYGAFWCPHCQSTKALFGKSAKLLPYVECSTPDGQGQTQVCIDKKISSYPTWTFKDGSTLDGEQTLQSLSEKTNCPLPSTSTSTIATTTLEVGSSSSAVASTTIKIK